MLDQNSIAQLSQLKQDILASKDFAEGLVVGANGRFGFVKLDDGRTAFLNPERMQRVLPGDRIKVNVIKNDKDQLEAELESLLESSTATFIGNYRVKGNNHFVQSESHAGGRWLFIPPPFRKKCKENDLVLAEINKHPFQDGKASVKILSRIGAEGDDYLHHNLVIAEYNLARYWSKDALKQAEEITQAQLKDKTERADLTHLAFVTIDSASTRDMDDAIFVEPNDNGGWRLQVAIADPGHFIQPGSPLAKAAKGYGQSVYLPNRPLSMLPESLASDGLSLLEGTERPALVATIAVQPDGSIQSYDFQFATIRSRQKLTYTDVAAYLSAPNQAETNWPAEVVANLTGAHELAQQRFKYRQSHQLTYDEQPDYDFQLNKQGLIESIQKRERNEAHRVIEEAMLCTNLCAGEFLAQHKTGLFSTHLGFRPERIGEVKAVLREDLGEEFDTSDIQTFAGHLRLVRHLQQSEQHQKLLAPLKRMMQNAEISSTAAPHMNMGVEHYATITSPIRRYVDLCNHWSIIQILNKQTAQQIPQRVLEQLQETLQAGRQASRQLEQILIGHYLKGQKGLEGKGVIRIVTQQGFGVRLVATGIEGFVQFSKKTEKTFDAKRMSLTVAGQTYHLDDQVDVKILDVDLDKRRVKMGLATPVTEPASSQQTAPVEANTAE